MYYTPHLLKNAFFSSFSIILGGEIPFSFLDLLPATLEITYILILIPTFNQKKNNDISKHFGAFE